MSKQPKFEIFHEGEWHEVQTMPVDGPEIEIRQKPDGFWYWSCEKCPVSFRCLIRERTADAAIMHDCEEDRKLYESSAVSPE